MELCQTTTDSDFDEKSKQVANLLCKAAGIFEFLRGEAGKWLAKPDPIFTELRDDILVALIKYEKWKRKEKKKRWKRRNMRENEKKRTKKIKKINDIIINDWLLMIDY